MDQIKFLDKFIRYYGIKGLGDYETKIATKEFKQIPDFIEMINSETDTMLKLFGKATISLSKTKHRVVTHTQAMGLLKRLLNKANIPFENVRARDTTRLRDNIL